MIVKTVEQQSTRRPRPNLRASLTDNTSIITGNQYLADIKVTSTNTLGYGKLTLAPGNNAGFASAPVEGIAKQFQNGLYLPGTRLDYYPSVGLTTQGNVAIAYIDSPTLMKAFHSLSAGQQLAFIQSIGNVKTGPIWQPMTFTMPQSTRRKDYVVDPSISLSDTNELDLAVQGMYLWVAYGLVTQTSDLTFGQMVLHTRMRCRELTSATAA